MENKGFNASTTAWHLAGNILQHVTDRNDFAAGQGISNDTLLILATKYGGIFENTGGGCMCTFIPTQGNKILCTEAVVVSEDAIGIYSVTEPTDVTAILYDSQDGGFDFVIWYLNHNTLTFALNFIKGE